MTKTTFQMQILCSEFDPLVGPVTLSHCRKSHDFFDAHRGIYSVNEFPSYFMVLWYVFLMYLTLSTFLEFIQSHFLCNIPKCAYKCVDGSIASVVNLWQSCVNLLLNRSPSHKIPDREDSHGNLNGDWSRRQGCPNLLLEGCCPAEFSSNPI